MNMNTELNTELQSFIEKYDLLGCIQCGRCTGGCPVTVRTNLNVRRFVYDSRDEEMLEELANLTEIWDCTACNTCAVRCPKGLKPVEVLIGLRNILVGEGVVQPTVRDALESIFLPDKGNPWGKSRATRCEWMEGLDVKIADPEDKVENLFFVCCTIAYDPKVQGIAKNLVKLLNSAGIDYGFIGEEESCCASEAHNIGEEDLFEEMIEVNTELLNEYDAKRLVAISPHCYSAFKNQYPGIKAEVIHYTHLLKELLEEKKIAFTKECQEKIVFHDPCFLGKQNLVFDEPRYILSQINGAEIVEFDRKRERSLCCEGGGGKMWVEGSESKVERLAETRARDAKELGATVLAVACPFCVLTLDDALKAKGYEEEMRVAELLELLGPLAE
jgi:Fe-S oxidoreductase